MKLIFLVFLLFSFPATPRLAKIAPSDSVAPVINTTTTLSTLPYVPPVMDRGDVRSALSTRQHHDHHLISGKQNSDTPIGQVYPVDLYQSSLAPELSFQLKVPQMQSTPTGAKGNNSVNCLYNCRTTINSLNSAINYTVSLPPPPSPTTTTTPTSSISPLVPQLSANEFVSNGTSQSVCRFNLSTYQLDSNCCHSVHSTVTSGFVFQVDHTPVYHNINDVNDDEEQNGGHGTNVKNSELSPSVPVAIQATSLAPPPPPPASQSSSLSNGNLYSTIESNHINDVDAEQDGDEDVTIGTDYDYYYQQQQQQYKSNRALSLMKSKLTSEKLKRKIINQSKRIEENFHLVSNGDVTDGANSGPLLQHNGNLLNKTGVDRATITTGFDRNNHVYGGSGGGGGDQGPIGDASDQLAMIYDNTNRQTTNEIATVSFNQNYFLINRLRSNLLKKVKKVNHFLQPILFDKNYISYLK